MFTVETSRNTVPRCLAALDNGNGFIAVPAMRGAQSASSTPILHGNVDHFMLSLTTKERMIPGINPHGIIQFLSIESAEPRRLASFWTVYGVHAHSLMLAQTMGCTLAVMHLSGILPSLKEGFTVSYRQERMDTGFIFLCQMGRTMD